MAKTRSNSRKRAYKWALVFASVSLLLIGLGDPTSDMIPAGFVGLGVAGGLLFGATLVDL